MRYETREIWGRLLTAAQLMVFLFLAVWFLHMGRIIDKKEIEVKECYESLSLVQATVDSIKGNGP